MGPAYGVAALHIEKCPFASGDENLKRITTLAGSRTLDVG